MTNDATAGNLQKDRITEIKLYEPTPGMREKIQRSSVELPHRWRKVELLFGTASINETGFLRGAKKIEKSKK